MKYYLLHLLFGDFCGSEESTFVILDIYSSLKMTKKKKYLKTLDNCKENLYMIKEKRKTNLPLFYLFFFLSPSLCQKEKINIKIHLWNFSEYFWITLPAHQKCAYGYDQLIRTISAMIRVWYLVLTRINNSPYSTRVLLTVL